MNKIISWIVDGCSKIGAMVLAPLGGVSEWWRGKTSVLSDLRIIFIVLILLAVALVYLGPGWDVVSDLVDISNATPGGLSASDFGPIFWRWFYFLVACVLTGLNGWFWAGLLYKTNPSQEFVSELPENQGQPKWFVWLRRLIGVAPLLIAMGAMIVTAPVGDIWLALSIFGLVVFLLFRFVSARHSIAQKFVSRAYRKTRFANGKILQGDVWFALGSMGLAVIVFLVILYPGARQTFTATIGTAAVTFFAIGGVIAITSPLIWFARQYNVPLVTFGLIIAAVGSCANDNHGIRALDNVMERPQLSDALRAWESQPGIENSSPLIIVTTSGGASRAAYWAASVMRAMDERTSGAFSRQTFAISSVSGGTLGAVGYSAWLADHPFPLDRASDKEKNDHIERTRRFTQTFFGTDFLGPALAGLLYPDLLQRFIPFNTSLPSRATYLEEAWEKGWLNARISACGLERCGVTDLSKDFLHIWKNRIGGNQRLHWVPLVLSNGMHVETGKRIITAPIQITSDIVEDAYDFFQLFGKNIRASTAVSNSARFPIVSPAGTLSFGKKSLGRIVDGGYFENGGVETALDSARAIRANGSLRPILVVEISNNDRSNQADIARRNQKNLQNPVAKTELQSASVFLGEITAIVSGLYNAGSGREVMSAKRLSDVKGARGLINGYFNFPLNPVCQIKNGDGACARQHYTTMSWHVTQQSRYAMDVRMNVEKSSLGSL